MRLLVVLRPRLERPVKIDPDRGVLSEAPAKQALDHNCEAPKKRLTKSER